MKSSYLYILILAMFLGTACSGTEEGAEPAVTAVEEAEPAEVLYTLKADVYPEEGGLVYPVEKLVPAGTTVEVKAIPVPGYEFEAWSGGETSTSPNLIMTMEGDRQIIAHFKLILTPTPNPLSENAHLFAGVWHRNAFPGENGAHEVNYCELGDVWVCNFKNLPEPELGWGFDGSVSGVFEGTTILDWNCPSWFPEYVCLNKVFVVGGSTDFMGVAGEYFPVDIEYIVIETGSGYMLYEYWVDRFACNWYRTFDEVLNGQDDCFWP